MKLVCKCVLILVVFSLIPLLSSCKKSDSGDGGGGGGTTFPWFFFPDDNEISGWVKDGPVETATTTQELWDLINGEGQVYMDNGFSSCGRQVYDGNVGGSPAEIRHLYVYDLSTAADAEAAYDDPASGQGSPWTDSLAAGDEARIDDTALGFYTIDFRRSKYFTKITIDQKTNDALDVIKLFCHNIDGKIQGSSTTTKLPLGG